MKKVQLEKCYLANVLLYIDSYETYATKKIETLIESLEIGDTHAN